MEVDPDFEIFKTYNFNPASNGTEDEKSPAGMNLSKVWESKVILSKQRGMPPLRSKHEGKQRQDD